MDLPALILPALAAGALTLFLTSRRLRARRLAFIDGYEFHEAIRKRLQARHDSLSEPELDLVFKRLRDYFHICNQSKRRVVAMPSQVVDDAWHEFILFTKAYEKFCRKALGRFLHHTPAEAMAGPRPAQEGIRRAWRLACAREGVNPRAPERLPLLFDIDGRLSIPNGFRYVPDCGGPKRRDRGDSYCATHIGCASGCAGDSGGESGDGGFFSGWGDSDGGDGGGCGGVIELSAPDGAGPGHPRFETDQRPVGYAFSGHFIGLG